MTDLNTPRPRHLSLWDAVSTVVGIILGSGIFIAPASIANITGNPWVAAGIWFTGAGIAVCGALCYAECSIRLPSNGGFFVFYEAAFGDAMARVAGWTALLITYPASLAGIALVFSHYMGEACPSLAIFHKWIGVALLVAIAMLNSIGVSFGTWSLRALTAAKVIAIVWLCAAALFYAAGHNSYGIILAQENNTALLTNMQWSSLLTAFATMMWTYDGWTDVTLIAGEIKDPNRNISRSVIISLGLLASIYALVQAAVLHLLPRATAAQSHHVLADAIGVVWGPSSAQGLAWLIALSATGTVLGLFFVTARLAGAMATLRAIPAIFAKNFGTAQAPLLSTLGMLALAIFYLETNTFAQLLGIFSFAIWLFYGATGIALFRLRKQGIGEPTTWRAPFGIMTPSVLVGTAFGMIIMQTVHHPKRVFLGSFILLCVAVLDRYHHWVVKNKF